MKQYTFDPDRKGEGIIETRRRIPDGYSFVFSFSALSYKKCREIETKLFFNDFTHRVHLTPGQLRTPDKVQTSGLGQDFATTCELGKNERNIVIKVDKTSRNSVMTYINGEFITTLRSSTHWRNEAGFMDLAGLRVIPAEAVAATLTVFDYDERETAEAFAQAIKDPEASSFASERTMEAKARAAEDFARERAAADFAKELGAREKALEAREKALEQKEKDASAIVCVIPSIDMPVAGDMDWSGDESDMHGAGADNYPSGLNVHPPDTDFMKLSATVGWLRAVTHVLGTSLAAKIQTRHDSLMSDWVAARGDNISCDAYDYFVYSHGVIWPQAVRESTADGDLTKVQGRHMVIMEVLM